jgi:hypothetical protein
LNLKLQNGRAQLKFDEERAGYLRSVLQVLDVPVESQVAVFSKTSLQIERIEPRNPRTILQRFACCGMDGWRLYRIGRPGSGWGALSAFSIAFLSLIFEIVLVGEVASPLLFAAKVTVAICAANGLGAYLYWRGTRRVERLAASSQS